VSARVTMEELATLPRWPEERLRAAPGKVRGNALRAWGVHVTRLWGPEAPHRVRERLGFDALTLPDVPTKRHWYPVWVQVDMAHVIVDEWFGGDILAFESVFSGTSGTGDKVMRWVGSKLGPTAVLKRSDRYHESVCTVGKLHVEANATSSRLDFRGADIFGNPSWRVLQMMGIRSMLDFMKRELTSISGLDHGPRDFVLEVSWR